MPSPPARGRPGKHHGWHRTYLPSVVRQGPAADSPSVKELPTGSLVYATEAVGGSIRVSRPVVGWMSATTADGVASVFPEMPLRELGEDDDIQSALQSDKKGKLNEELRAKVAEVTQVQVRLAESMRRLKENTDRLKRQPLSSVGAVLKNKAPKVSRQIAHTAGQAAQKVAKSQEVQRIFKGLSHEPSLQGLFH